MSSCHCLCLLAVALIFLCAPAMATLLPAERNHTSSLNGKWRFKVLVRPGEDQPAATGGWKAPYPLEVPQELANFTDLSFVEDTTWQDLDVPGNWEMAGHSPATYNQPDNACGLYRKWFEVPASWSGRLVRLNFDGVQNGAEVWFNGQPVQVAE